tara:strand:- start:45 stop:212 length:168 start_codon:yes stop_codon:yes gene_type:complete
MKNLLNSEIIVLRQSIAYRLDNDTLTTYQRKQLNDLNIKLFNNQINLYIDKINAS